MSKLQRQVLEFHRVFDHPVADSPTIPPDERVRFRARFIVEEVFEMLSAVFPDSTEPSFWEYLKEDIDSHITHSEIDVDLPLFVDALADIDYVVEGCRLEFGINGEPIADEVHRANMTKAFDCDACAQRRSWNVDGKAMCGKCGSTGKIIIKREDGKTLKPEGWTPPDIAGCLERQKLKAPHHTHSEESLYCAIRDDKP